MKDKKIKALPEKHSKYCMSTVSHTFDIRDSNLEHAVMPH